MAKVILEKYNGETKITLSYRFLLVLLSVTGGALIAISLFFLMRSIIDKVNPFSNLSLSFIIILPLLFGIGVIIAGVIFGQSESIIIDKNKVTYRSSKLKSTDQVIPRNKITDIWVEAVDKLHHGTLIIGRNDIPISLPSQDLFIIVKTSNKTYEWCKKSIGDSAAKIGLATILRDELGLKGPTKVKDVKRLI